MPGGTVMVDRAPEGTEPEVALSVVAPKKQPKPVGVGATDDGCSEMD
jgi:ATP-dependent Clp protease ATP-binding subunit ClpC